jgi:23S rRNA (guanosine2251-2'-O)-methyltransferase
MTMIEKKKIETQIFEKNTTEKTPNNALPRLSQTDFKNSEKNPFVIILDNVRSLMNVGSAFRTGDAFLVEKIYLCGITGTPPHREIQKTALGATETVAWQHHSDTLMLTQDLQKQGYKIVVIEQTEPKIYLSEFEVDNAQKYAFVFGNEVEGVQLEVVKNADYCVEIPQFGTKHSLNIAVSIGVVVWDFLMKIRNP